MYRMYISRGNTVIFYDELKNYLTTKASNAGLRPTLQVKTILVARATKILDLATKLKPKSPAWRLKLKRRIESVSLIIIYRLKFFIGNQTWAATK